MRTWARWTARATLLTASFATAGVTTVGIASAGTHTTSGNNSILGGNQVNAPISVPVNACGNALALLGDAFAGCKGGASVTGGGGGGTWTTSGNNSIGGGNQVNVPISVPVNICGNAAAVLGDAFAGCKGGASVNGGGGGGTWTTSGNNSIGGGNQVHAPVRVPVDICGNAVGGDAFAGCKGGATVHAVHTDARTGGGGNTWTTSGNHSILGGNQINVPVKVPVDICGNAVAVLGDAFAGCKGGASTGPAHSNSSGTQHMTAAQVVRQSAPLSPAASPLSALSGIPVLSGLPVSGSSLARGGSPVSNLPIQTSLTSYTSQAPAPGTGTGSSSLLAIAAGAVLAGLATLVAAGRRLSIRKAGR